MIILSCNSCYMWDRRFSLKQQEAHQRKDCRSLRQRSLRGAIVLLKIFQNLFWKCLFLCVIVLLKSKCICFYKCAILTATFIAILVFQIKTEIYIHLVWFEQMANCTNFIFPLQKRFLQHHLISSWTLRQMLRKFSTKRNLGICFLPILKEFLFEQNVSKIWKSKC